MKENPNFDGGILLFDKPSGITSQDAVNAVRRAFGTRQAGHTGTLDPLASGLLTVLVGRAVKASEYAVCDRKSYEAVIRLGITTDTEDITGTVLSKADVDITTEFFNETLKRFTGEILQVPPMYSAIKIGGKKLYELAREGKTVDRTARPVRIYSLSSGRISNTDFKLFVECSSGTYIRTLCADIGAALGTGACMSELRRTSVGHFKIDDAIGIDALKELSAESAPLSRLIPVERYFDELPAVTLPAFYERLLRNGCEIYISKLGRLIDAGVKTGDRFRIIASDGSFLALAEAGDYTEGKAIKAIKLFKI